MGNQERRAPMKHSLIVLVLVSFLPARGGGGGGSLPTDPPGSGGGGSGSGGSGGGATGPTEPTAEDYRDAALILDIGSFGARYSDIESVAESGVDAWLDEQFMMPISLHETIVRRYGVQYGYDLQDSPIFPGLYRRFAFFENALTAPDQLRQVTAYALTQLFVVSQTGVLGNNPLGLSNYYDTLLTHSFGNYRDLLRAVTLHPAMGFYLSHVNNAKTDEDANTFPDENYARKSCNSSPSDCMSSTPTVHGNWMQLVSPYPPMTTQIFGNSPRYLPVLPMRAVPARQHNLGETERCFICRW